MRGQLRHWLDFLTERGVLPHTPALSVRTERLVVTEGKTPALEREEARALFAMLDAAARKRGYPGTARSGDVRGHVVRVRARGSALQDDGAGL